MTKCFHGAIAALTLAAGCASAAHAQSIVVNGGFESGFTGWTRADQIGSDGTFGLQMGLTSPVNTFTVPAPPEGTRAAMTDAGAGGSHVLYQDIVIPMTVTGATLQFSLYIRNGATAFTTPTSLDFATAALNQQARVDFMLPAADPFSVGGADVLQNVFQTTVGSPLITGYNTVSVNVTSLLAARAGQTIRLRFAEVDNVNFFNMGVDAVSLTVPTPGVMALLLPACMLGRRRR
jgi:hypothetical protein